MDISDTLAPDSDQLDAVDLLGGPRTFTIERVSRNSGEQPISIHLVEFPRVWRPGKSMRRILAACWGTDASPWASRLVTLYCDESVRFGSDVVGGTRVSHLSHIDAPRSIPLLTSRKRSAIYVVKPITVASLRAEWKHADPERRKVIEAQVAAIEPPAQPEPTDDPAGQEPNEEGALL